MRIRTDFLASRCRCSTLWAAQTSNSTFEIALCFLQSEMEPDYAWALSRLRQTLNDYHINLPSSVILTDRELALMNALKTTFPTSANALCRWHIDVNITKYKHGIA